LARVAVVGGGSVGLWSAYSLALRGHDVSVLEAGAFLVGCSMKNSGLLVPSHVVPLAAPGVVAKGLQWLADAKSPFYLRPSLDPRMVRWAALFRQCATETKAAAGAEVLSRLSTESLSLYRDLASELDLGLRESGLLMLARTRAGLEEEVHAAELASKFGVEARVLCGDELGAHEPLAKCVGGVLYPGDAQLDPTRMMSAMLDRLREMGVSLQENLGRVSLRLVGEEVETKIGGASWDADFVVLACGARSGAEMQELGHRLPMVGGKGYTFDVPASGLTVARPTILVEDRVAMSPLGDRVRLGGTMEIGTDPEKVAIRRVRGIADAVPRYLGAAAPEPTAVWSGQRPCSPDGLPYIGRTAMARNLIVATGHAMLGITLSPVTGRLVADSLEGRNEPELSPDRFH